MAKNINPNGITYIKEYDILSYCWRYKLLGKDLRTVDGKIIEVVDTGLLNRNFGADYFNAKIRIDHRLFVGNVVVLQDAGQWYREGLAKDDGFNNVILVVCQREGQAIVNAAGEEIPTLLADVPQYIRYNYQRLLSDKGCSLCKCHIRENVPHLTVHAWTAALSTEYLDERQKMFEEKASKTGWENALCSEIGMGGNISKTISGKLMKAVLSAESVADVRKAVEEYLAATNQRHGKNTVEEFVITVVCPWMFAYGSMKSQARLCDKAFELMEYTFAIRPAETKAWQEAGVEHNNGFDWAAVRHLEKQYCNKKRCLHCRFGYEFLKKNQALSEKQGQRKEPLQLSFCFC